MKKTRNRIWFILSITGCLFGHPVAYGQFNFLGKPGLMTIPTAEWEKSKELGLSFSFIPAEYSSDIFNFRSINSEFQTPLNFYSARILLTSFLEVSFNIADRPLLGKNHGIGDRHLDFRLLIMTESKNFPAIVLGWTPPGSVAPVMAHDYIVMTKTFKTSLGEFSLTSGYGSPYIFVRSEEKGSAALKFIKKENYYDGTYLTGFFGGISYKPIDFGGLMLEYNTETFNAGAFLVIKDWLHLQAYTFEGKQLAFQVAASLNLDFAPRSLRRYEKHLD